MLQFNTQKYITAIKFTRFFTFYKYWKYYSPYNGITSYYAKIYIYM